MKKIIALCILLLTFCLLICSCTGDQPSAGTQTTEGQTDAPVSTTAGEDEKPDSPTTDEPSLDDVWDSVKPGTDDGEWSPSYELPLQ